MTQRPRISPSGPFETTAAPGTAYQIVADDGAPLPQEGVLNVINGTLADAPGVSTDLTLQYQQIEDSDGLQLPRQLGTHYNAELLVTDDPAIGCTRIRAPGIAVAQAAADAAQGTANAAGAVAVAAQTTANARLSSFDGRTAIAASDVVASLAALGVLAGSVNGSRVFVLDQGEVYLLDTANTFAVFSPLIVAAAGGGNWFKRSKAYVVANYTLWVAGFNSLNYALGFTPGQLLATGSVTPDIILGSSNNTENSQSLVVDGRGNLWWNIQGPTTGQAVRKIALADTLQSGTPAPAALLLYPAGSFSGEIAFDKLNNLWLSHGASDVSPTADLRKFAPTQYAYSGTPTPLITVQPRAAIGTKHYMLFDDANNLWCASFQPSTNYVCMFAAAQLLASSTATESPVVIWSGANVVGPSGMAFGPSGLLWVANYVLGGGTIKAYSPVDPVSGNPAVVINLTSASFVGVTDLAFDAAGNLWALSFDNGHLLRIPAASLAASGAVVPDINITISTPTGGVPGGCPSMNFSYNPNRSGLLPSGGPAA